MSDNISLPKNNKNLYETQRIFLQPIDQHYDSNEEHEEDYGAIGEDLANLLTKVSTHSDDETEEMENNLDLNDSTELQFTKFALARDWVCKVKDLRQLQYENALALRNQAQFKLSRIQQNYFCDFNVYNFKNSNIMTLNNVMSTHFGF